MRFSAPGLCTMRCTKIARRVDLVRLKLAGIHQILHLRHRNAPARSRHGIEIARRLAVDQVPAAIALPRLHQRQVRANPALQDVSNTIEIRALLSPRPQKSQTRCACKIPESPRPQRASAPPECPAGRTPPPDRPPETAARTPGSLLRNSKSSCESAASAAASPSPSHPPPHCCWQR